jgi:hypothetical protein
MAVFGFRPDDLDENAEVWPDIWPAFLLFEAMSTQWRTGMGGAVGLDYNAIPAVAQMLNIKRRDLPRMFHDLRVMESEALLIMSESK